MKVNIEHIGIWTKDLEMMRAFYMNFFGLQSNEKYVNPSKGFSSYFLSFDSGARLELMHRKDIQAASDAQGEVYGMAHIAISLESKENVLALTEKSRALGLQVIGAPRTTGDGYFESVIEDPEGNWIELTV